MNNTAHVFGCINNTIKVAAGHLVDLVNPDPETIDIQSIAAALSKICRFGGHCPRFYSVAEHCIHATTMAISDGFVGEAIVAVFLHDAAEAYVGDMVKPLKVTMPQYWEAELRIDRAIESKFSIEFKKFEDTIKRYDRIMLKAEKASMWPRCSDEWFGFSEIEERKINFGFWDPSYAEMQFLVMATTLQLMELPR